MYTNCQLMLLQFYADYKGGIALQSSSQKRISYQCAEGTDDGFCNGIYRKRRAMVAVSLFSDEKVSGEI